MPCFSGKFVPAQSVCFCDLGFTADHCETGENGKICGVKYKKTNLRLFQLQRYTFIVYSAFKNNIIFAILQILIS